MLDNITTFQSSSTSDPCTFGIMMATNVLECEEFIIILLDTEGTDAAKGKQASKHGDVKKSIIFCTLMSSYFIYNTAGAIKEHDLQEMR